MSDVFIAHVEEDADVALAIALGLEEAGYETWIYEVDSIPGPSYLVHTGLMVEQAKAMLVVVSPHSVGSRQITKEVVRAHESGKEFVPVLRGITHVEFQNRQPEWREAFGAAASISIPQEGVAPILPRIIEGLKILGIPPRPQTDAARIVRIRKALDELQSQGKVVRTWQTSMPAATTVEQAKRRPKWRKTALMALGAVALVVVSAIVINIIGFPPKPGPPGPTPTPVSPGTIRVNVMVEGATADVIVDGRAYQPTHSIDVTPGKSITLEVKDPPPRADYREVFFKWSDGGDRRHEVKPESSTNYIAYFKRQYPLKVSSAYGAIEGGGWCDEGAFVTPSVTPTTVEGQGVRRVHTGWTRPLPITMTGPDKVEATWKTQYQLWVSSPYGVIEGGGWRDEGDSVTPSVTPTTVEGQGVRRVHTGWTRPLPITMNAPEKVEAIWKTQYFLKVSSPYGTAKGEDWYDEGVSVTPSVTPTVVTGQGARNVQTGWSLPLPIAMTGPKMVEATWKSQYLRGDVSVSLDGPPGSPLTRNPSTNLQLQTDVSLSRVTVDTPDGRTLALTPFTDAFSPAVDQVSIFRYNNSFRGMPVASGTYKFTGWDAQGNLLIWDSDIYVGGSEPAPPQSISASVVQGKGIQLDWTASTIPGVFDPGNGIGWYQININKETGGPAVYGGQARNTSHLIPQFRQDLRSQGFPRDWGSALLEMGVGIYNIRVASYTNPAKGSAGSGVEAAASDPAQKVRFEIRMMSSGMKLITILPQQ